MVLYNHQASKEQCIYTSYGKDGYCIFYAQHLRIPLKIVS